MKNTVLKLAALPFLLVAIVSCGNNGPEPSEGAMPAADPVVADPVAADPVTTPEAADSVAADPAASGGKLDNARKLGVRTIALQEFLELVHAPRTEDAGSPHTDDLFGDL